MIQPQVLKEAIEKAKPADVMVRLAGKVFYCDCGCNVFHHPKDEYDNRNKYVCNACLAQYTGE